MKAPETIEQQTLDSEMIFQQITSGDFTSYSEAEQAVMKIYVIDVTISRAGISHALKRLEKYFRK